MEQSELSRWEQLEQRARAIKEIVIVVGLLVAGAWAFYRFIVVERPGARVAYESAVANSRSFGLQITFDVHSVAREKCRIYGVVQLRNIGTGTASVTLNRAPPMLISKVSPAPDGHFIEVGSSLSAWIDDPDQRPRQAIAIAPGRSTNLAFAVDLEKRGIYLIKFAAPVWYNRFSQDTTNRWSERIIVDACSEQNVKNKV